MPPIFAPFVFMWAFIREIYDLLKAPHSRAILYWLFLLLLTGTIFYNRVEGWGFLDSLYFTVVTLATVGYGDLTPSTPAAKLFTIFYIFLGISLFVTFVGLLAKDRQLIFQKRTQRLGRDADTGNEPEQRG